MPTFAEFVPRVAAAVTPGTLKAYGTYWNRVVDEWGSRRLNEPGPLEIGSLGKQIRANRVIRRNGRGGSGAEENYVAAMRCLYKRAVDNGFISEADNPASRVAKPRRQASNRHALADKRLTEITEIAATTGNDPALDSLLLRFHTETACRRGGALNLRRCDLDERQCLVRLREKGGTERWQPVSPTLMRHLLAHWGERGDGDPTGKLFWFRHRRPVTHRRYDHLWTRIGEHLPWVATQGISVHWLRHTVITWVERTFSYATARAFAGHSESSGDVGSTATYAKADLSELAAVVAALTGEAHPLAPHDEDQ
ncbi:site-specific recombinase XerD [Micromonospora pisi]|uniref:Site-specific recombinase XerD n=1 Tax=Micromonospora pisi TaxID=589240 RepID=A0A495JF03_9ACTN|nr:site-specific recombinase XerD [Micromonospora pisi]